jgi:AraC family chitin signaling transcriptional activator
LKPHPLFFRIFFAIVNLTVVSAQEILPLHNYAPNSYKAENQNWKISQSSDKVLYFANNDGLLEFEGATWKLHPSPNNSIVRSVAVINDLVYSGCHMEFGYWQRDQFGELQYISISEKLQEPLLEDEEFWNILEFEEWVLFQSLNRIYIYNTINESFKIINSDTVLEKIFKTNKTLYFQTSKEGFYKIENGEAVLISDHPVVKENIIVNVSSRENNLLLLTQEQGFFQIDPAGKLSKWISQCDALFADISVYSAAELKDKSFILGTISNGMYHITNTGEILSNINQEKGLYNNTVLSIFEDLEQNIWLGLDNGISVLNLKSPYKIYNDVYGKLGTVYTSAIYKGKLYLGTNQGLFCKKRGIEEDFKMIAKTEGQVWSLTEIDNELFCGHNAGTFLVDGTKAQKISNIPGTWNLKKIPQTKNTLLQGNYNGLYILEKKNKQWQLRNKIAGFDNSCHFFEMNAAHEIFISHEHKGLIRIKTDENYTKVLEYEIDRTKKGKKSSLIKHNDKLFFSYEKGIFIYDTIAQSFRFDSFYSSEMLSDENYTSGKLVATKNNTLWGFTDRNIVRFAPGKINSTPEVSKIALPTYIRRDYSGWESITHLSGEKYLFGTSYGYLIIDLEKIQKKAYRIKINNIAKGVLNEVKKLVPKSQNNTFEFEANNLDFSYSVPNYDKYTDVSYQHNLSGIYKDWSPWSKKSSISFENLPFGNYTFQVRAKVGNTASENTARYTFQIRRPWYISNPLIVIYTLVFVALFLIIHNGYQQYYKKQKRKLLAKKQREFERVRLENDREIMKLRNDKLLQDIESKNRELAVSTMSIIKKNEFLNSIKKELTKANNKDTVAPVLKIIDKNLNQNSDWERFQEAFNNADKDFLKKVKERYPKLTPNDLRLCAYLRLNLSSKEIAPLLNISYKSVEIKRYRLRKKMNLDAKSNLTHHILEI